MFFRYIYRNRKRNFVFQKNFFVVNNFVSWGFGFWKKVLKLFKVCYVKIRVFILFLEVVRWGGLFSDSCRYIRKVISWKFQKCFFYQESEGVGDFYSEDNGVQVRVVLCGGERGQKQFYVLGFDVVIKGQIFQDMCDLLCIFKVLQFFFWDVQFLRCSFLKILILFNFFVYGNTFFLNIICQVFYIKLLVFLRFFWWG